MTRSNLPGTIFVELARPQTPNTPAVIGSDAIFYVDGRLTRENVMNAIYDRYSSYLSRGWQILGYTRRGDYSGRIYKF